MKHHYVYYTYEEFGRGYIGMRSSKVAPEQDPYMGSHKDKSYRPTHKIILETFDTREEAAQAEIDLHKHFKVCENPHFANKARATHTGFSALKEGAENNKYNKRTWYHIDHGTFVGGAFELIEAFPDQNLNSAHLSSVGTGKRSEHKGWTIHGTVSKKRGAGRNWFHPEHGIVLNVSNRALCKMFTEESYYHNMLSRVIKGRLEHHKGWVLYHTAMTKEELLNV